MQRNTQREVERYEMTRRQPSGGETKSLLRKAGKMITNVPWKKETKPHVDPVSQRGDVADIEIHASGQPQYRLYDTKNVVIPGRIGRQDGDEQRS